MGFVADEDDNPFAHHKNKYDINGKIMVTALISISIIIFLATILRMYIRSLIRCRQAQGRATLYTTRNSQIFDVTSVSRVEPPKNSLDPSVITSLPIFLYKRNDHHDIECSICLSIIEDGELVRILPNCKHNFHVECIDKWFNCHSTCPVCRTEAEPRLILEPREGVVSCMPPSVPPMDSGNLSVDVNLEGTSSSVNGSSSRLSSFKRIILSRERSSQGLQVQSCSRGDRVDDIESGRSRI
ncbi:RING-H2 finger protein ATL40-like [Lycium barbarum]|uniref:RING-H2 finger protein ATL40-like n=1 Tax=Lycium barbarum TaxID=112863 RepID=UPI00293F3695|nr:RING-H2 finger protein ATL40-like [Lycium barbarum]